MTEAMRVLYDYTLETPFDSMLPTQQYHALSIRLDQLAQTLLQAQPENLRSTFESYQDVLYQQQLR